MYEIEIILLTYIIVQKFKNINHFQNNFVASFSLEKYCLEILKYREIMLLLELAVYMLPDTDRIMVIIFGIGINNLS